MEMKKLIKNGLIYDGTGSKPYVASILIKDDHIVDITSTEDVDADLIIEANMKAVTPGFIDTHRHCDIAALIDSNFGTIELAQGITTVVCGNCGLTPFPTVESTRKEYYDFIEPCLGKAPEWLKLSGFPDFIKALEKTTHCINIGGLIGSGAVKVAVKGFGKGSFTQTQMETAKAYLREAIESGAFGVSTGIMYVPECYSTMDEYIELLGSVTEYNTVVSFHVRGEGDSLVSSVEEVICIGQRAHLSVNISHFKAVGVANWNKTIFEAIEKIEKARADGQDVTVDFYPYTGGSTTLMSLIPPSIQEPDLKETLSLLATAQGRNRLRKEIYRPHDGWDNMVTSIGWERIIINSVNKERNKNFLGKNVGDIARELGYSDPVDFICDLLIDEQGKVGIITMSMAQSDVDSIARLPYSFVISDSLYGGMDSPHPRLYGSFPRIIRDYVVERRILSMETAIQKMTQIPARRYNISGRGSLIPGNYADINIFDPKNLTDKASFRNPKQLSCGMDMVLVNGEIVWKDNGKTGIRKGMVIKCN